MPNDVDSGSYNWKNRLGGRRPAPAQPPPEEAPAPTGLVCPACGAAFNLTPAETEPEPEAASETMA